MRSLATALSLTCAILCACTAPCLEGPVAVYLTIDDSLTASAVMNAVVQVTDPSAVMQTDTIKDGVVYPLMYGRQPGAYTIAITSPGYLGWVRSVNVPSTGGGCKSVPVTLTAFLQR
jgi:hypothetical protein